MYVHYRQNMNIEYNIISIIYKHHLYKRDSTIEKQQGFHHWLKVHSLYKCNGCISYSARQLLLYHKLYYIYTYMKHRNVTNKTVFPLISISMCLNDPNPMYFLPFIPPRLNMVPFIPPHPLYFMGCLKN